MEYLRFCHIRHNSNGITVHKGTTTLNCRIARRALNVLIIAGKNKVMHETGINNQL